jgi:Chalcone isomerase-like
VNRNQKRQHINNGGFMKFLALYFLVFSQIVNAGPAIIASADKTVSQNVVIPSQPNLTYKTSDTTFEDIKLVESTLLQYQNKKTGLKPVAHGLRKKKVFGLVPVKVYLLEFLAANPAKLVKTDEGILASLKQSEAIQLKLTLQRDLSGKKITDSFKEALETNGVDIANLSKEMAEVMAELFSVSEFKKGETFSLLATWKDSGKESAKESVANLFIQKPGGSIKLISGDEKFVADLFSIWFGKPNDDKLADLKKTLLK